MNILLITPPLTQLNTPYPATPYLKGFLLSKGYEVTQVDLGIELINKLFTKETLELLFEEAVKNLTEKTSPHIIQTLVQKKQYLQTIQSVMEFLHGNDPTIATRICNGAFLPEGNRFKSMADLDWAFGNLGLTDKAKYMATLYIGDITDFIREAINPNFDLGRYAEHLSLFAPDFEPLQKALQAPTNLIDRIMLSILENKINMTKPGLIGFTVPFPGNLFGALKCGQYIKQKHPKVKIAWGGGYINTELRHLSDPAVFDYTDYILFDDGELPLWRLVETLEGKKKPGELIRTKQNNKGRVESIGWNDTARPPFSETSVPDYSDLPLHQYISLIETANPMHKLWSDGRWNKLTLAHGCYWAKCAFCDTSLPYISSYESGTASQVTDRIEAIIKQTGTTGFHFVDEAAPPKIIHTLSEEIIHRNLTLSWWTNIRFEKAFNMQLCSLMAKSGCIAVSGGIEVASNRLLKLMNKGVTIEQAATSAFHLTNNGIMVHAYLMYGFPSQSIQETIDALEIVRQMFNEGLIQSAFWHRYAMTVHSPSGIHPQVYGAEYIKINTGSFANNEIPFTDGQHIDLDMIGDGLRRATFNYMHGLCLDWPVLKWFQNKVPKATVSQNYIRKHIQSLEHLK